ncbi:MAG TPA: Gfo/Idh/MocA family oxidoreductase [Magnetospirillum sp.]|nr:Gfo/Idh/MocA family oxidoreductase [Magnetospirillum sp.]
MRIGVIGLSPGNGHPFSFSAIVNGFDEAAFEQAGWPVILNYLKAKGPQEFGFDGVRVTHAWTQDADLTRKLCAACRIDNAVAQPADMLGQVDAVMVLRDDAETHMPFAMPFLEAGLPVFVDKPLTLSRDELAAFRPYLESGKLMSCAGLRFAGELDCVRDDIAAFGEIKLIRGTVLNDWSKYGIHMLDAALDILPGRPVSVRRLKAPHDSLVVELDQGPLVAIDAIGLAPKLFSFGIYGSTKVATFDLYDNFTAFRRVLGAFIAQVRTGEPSIAPADTVSSILTIIAGLEAQPGGPAVAIQNA